MKQKNSTSGQDKPPKNGSDTWRPPQKEYNLHLGEIIHRVIDNTPDLLFKDVAEKIGMSKTGFHSKLNSPVYGNIYDLIKVSVVVGHDFISYAEAVIRNEGLDIEKIYTEREVKQLREKNDQLERDIERIKRNNDTLHEHIEALKKDLERLKNT